MTLIRDPMVGGLLQSAENFWNQPGKVEALKSAVAIYGQSWVKIKESCHELCELQTSQLKDKVSPPFAHMEWQCHTCLGAVRSIRGIDFSGCAS